MVDIRSAREAYYGKKTVSRGRLSSVEMRDAGDGKITFRGFASTTDDSYPVYDWLGEYDETIARGAFGKALREQDDVRLLVNHDGVPIARTKSGTLDLTEITDPADDPQGRNQTGLWCEAPDLDAANPTVQEIRSAMARGDLGEMSFSFMATRQEWNEDFSQRTVLEVKLLDVSVVTYPANPATSASISDGRSNDALRESTLARIASGNRLDQEQHEFVREAIAQRDALVAAGIEARDSMDVQINTVMSDGAIADAVVARDAARALAAARLESAKADSGVSPSLARGGIVKGSHLVMVGETGPESVIPAH